MKNANNNVPAIVTGANGKIKKLSIDNLKLKLIKETEKMEKIINDCKTPSEALCALTGTDMIRAISVIKIKFNLSDQEMYCVWDNWYNY